MTTNIPQQTNYRSFLYNSSNEPIVLKIHGDQSIFNVNNNSSNENNTITLQPPTNGLFTSSHLNNLIFIICVNGTTTFTLKAV